MAIIWFGNSRAETSAEGIVFKPDVLEFRPVVQGQCRSQKVKAKNMTTDTVDKATFSIEESGIFRVQNKGHCADVLKPGKTCSIWVNFCPQEFDTTYESNLVFSFQSQKVPLQGRGLIDP